jgi:GntR family transcriptional regulator
MTEAPLDLTLTDASGVPYYRQIETQLAELIRLGKLPSGTRLPSVRELALELKVSVITTRRTYADLASA